MEVKSKSELIEEIERLQKRVQQLEAVSDKLDYEKLFAVNINLQNTITSIIFRQDKDIEDKLKSVIKLVYNTFSEFGLLYTILYVRNKRYHEGRNEQKCNEQIYTINSHFVPQCSLKLGFACNFGFYGKKDIFGELYTSVSNRIAGIIDLYYSQLALSTTNDRYKYLVTNIGNVIYEYDENGIITYLSPVIENILGYKPEQLIGEDFNTLIRMGSKFKNEKLNELRQNGKTETEYEIKDAAGNSKWIVMLTNARYQNGLFCGGAGILTDITVKKTMQATLHRSEAMYKSILNVSPDAFILTNMKGEITYVSPAVYKLYHSEDPDEYLGSNMFKFLKTEDQKRAKINTKRRLNGEKIGLMEYTGVRRDGSEFYFDANSETIDDDEGNPVGILYVIRDITERRIAEQKLRDSEALYHSIMTASPDHIVVTDLEGKFVLVSPKGYELFGLERNADMTGYTLFDFLTEEDRLKAYGNIQKMYDGIFEGVGEYRGKKIDGTVIPIDVNAEFIRDESGNPKNLIFVVRDISERKLAEKQLRESELRYKTFFEDNKSTMLLIDPEDGSIKGANNAAVDYYGWTAEEFASLNISQINTLPKEEILILLRNTIHGNKRHHLFQHRLKTGDVRNVEVYAGSIVFGESTLVYSIIHDISKRVEAERKLKESEARFRMIFENAFDGISIFEENEDVNQRKLIDCNEQYAAMSGYSKQELLDTVFVNKLMVNIETDNNKVRLKSLTDQSGYHGQFKWIRPDGKDNIVQYNARPIELNGKLYSIGIDRDITEYKQYEKQLIKLSQAVEQSPVSIVITDLDGNIEYANPQACKTTGYTCEELKGKNPRVLQSGETSKDEYKYLWDSILQGKEWHGMFHNKKKTGELYWESSSVAPIFDDRGSLINYIAVKEDVTEKRKTEEALKQSEQKLKDAQRITGMGSWEVNLLTGVAVWSENQYRLFDLDPEIHNSIDLHKYFLSHLHPDDKIKIDNSFSVLLKSDEQLSVEIRAVKDNGEIIWLLNNTVPEYDNKGQLVGLRGSNIDITQKKNFEQQIIELNRDLELKIKSRTEELEKANEAKSEFLSRMSHELRTPMNSILGFAQLLEMGELNNTQKKAVGHILHSGRHLLSLINEVLDISKIESGHLSISPEPVKPDDVITEAIGIMASLSEKSGIAISYSAGIQKDISVLTDKQSYKQILLNLLNNAIKYNRPHGKVQIELTLTDGGEYAKLQVSDTGIGISKEDISRLFIPFERIGADKTGIEGTGLGLAVVKKLVDAMGGKLGVESTPGVGSSFWVSFKVVEQQIESLDHQIFDQGGDRGAGQKGTILYIEDNRSNIELVEQILSLRRPDIKLLSETDGKNGLKKAGEILPDLVLLDLNLPDIHGSDVLKQFYSLPERKHIPVIVVSADAMQNQIAELKELGAAEYITKPLDINQLLRIIDSYL